MRLIHSLKTISIAMMLVIAMPVFAEQAPVYDADNLPTQFDGMPDQGQAATGSAPDATPGPSADASANASSGAKTFAYSPQAPAQPLTLEQRMARMEQQINNLQNKESNAQMDSLQKQVQNLRNQVEELTHKQQQAENQQRTMYSDLDKRLAQQNNNPPAALPDQIVDKEIKAAKPKPVVPSTRAALADDGLLMDSKKIATAQPKPSVSRIKANASNNQPNVAEEQAIYQTAYNYIKAKKYNQAVQALQNMLAKYPTGQFAANAHYWLGELYGLMGKNAQAMTEFNTVVTTFGDSPRVSDAQLKLGLIYAAQFNWSDAKNAFKKVINQYPGSASAHLASEQLKQIRLAGH